MTDINTTDDPWSGPINYERIAAMATWEGLPTR
jgi:hypothetical protein